MNYVSKYTLQITSGPTKELFNASFSGLEIDHLNNIKFNQINLLNITNIRRDHIVSTNMTLKWAKHLWPCGIFMKWIKILGTYLRSSSLIKAHFDLNTCLSLSIIRLLFFYETKNYINIVLDRKYNKLLTPPRSQHGPKSFYNRKNC